MQVQVLIVGKRGEFMAILKNKTQGNYVMISQSVMHDQELGLTERGLLITLLSLPDGWNLSVKGLTSILPDGKDKVAKSLNTLINKGYVTREQGRGKRGVFDTNVLEVHQEPVNVEETSNVETSEDTSSESDSPCPENPVTVKPETDKPSAEKPAQLNNKDINNKNKKNKELNKQECEDTLPDPDYEILVKEFGKDLVDCQIKRIKDNHYSGCMNYKTVHEWCQERVNRKDNNLVPFKKQKIDHGFKGRDYDWDELDKKIFGGN